MSNSKNTNLLAPQYFKYFKEAGIDVKGFYPFDLLNEKRSNLIKKGLFKIFPDSYYKAINKNLLDLVDDFRPDILLLFKGTSIWPKTLKQIKHKGIKLVNYNPDDPFSKDAYQSNGHIQNSVELFDLYISFSKKIISELKHKFPDLSTAYLPFGHGLTTSQFEEIEKVPEMLSACFVGTADKDRKKFIEPFIIANIPLHLFGNGWDSYNFNREMVKVHSAITGLNYWKTLRSYRVQLNIFRPQNHNSHNMRSFEIPAAGGIMLAPKSIEHDLFFQDGKHYFSFKNTEEAIQKTQKIIAMNKKDAEEFRLQTRTQILASDYCYSQRASQMAKLLHSL